MGLVHRSMRCEPRAAPITTPRSWGLKTRPVFCLNLWGSNPLGPPSGRPLRRRSILRNGSMRDWPTFAARNTIPGHWPSLLRRPYV